MVNQKFISTIVDRYAGGLSAKEVAKELGISENKVNYWLGKSSVKKRTLSEAVYLKANKDGDPFVIDENPELRDPLLFGLGLGLYAGEGEKASGHQVRMTNSDYRLILVFRRFLREICQVKESRIHYSLICFNDSDIGEVEEYWLRKLELKGKVFGKIVQVPSQGRGTYRRKSKYGVCTLTFSNVRLKKWIMGQIDKLMGRPDSLVVKQPLGKG